jgi:5,10-methylenetetrahydrofolate reductase
MTYAKSMDVWIDMFHSIQRLTRRDTMVFLTDNAVGQAEEENLAHLTSNLGDEVDRSRIVPFLTTKHTLDYCRMYAKRAASFGFDALTVLGGDRHVGPSRCLPHAFELRKVIRQDIPGLTLGGWANPHGDPAAQADYLLDVDFTADFFLTQIVSHHDLTMVEAFLKELQRNRIDTPAIFGVFMYRSGNPGTLETLREFFPVPIAKVQEEFAGGTTPEEMCVRTIRSLFELGVTRVYVSNLGYKRVDARYRSLVNALGLPAAH